MNHTIRTMGDDLFLLKRIQFGDGCWQWTGGKAGRMKYGHLVRHGKHYQAHRAVYVMMGGVIPKDLMCDHLCRNVLCVNPSHIELVTNAENLLRGTGLPARNARKTHCKYGHPFNAENTITEIVKGVRTGRKCRTCSRNRSTRRRAAAKLNSIT